MIDFVIFVTLTLILAVAAYGLGRVDGEEAADKRFAARINSESLRAAQRIHEVGVRTRLKMMDEAAGQGLERYRP